MCVIAVLGAAPCQCKTAPALHASAPGRDDQRLTERVGMPANVRDGSVAATSGSIRTAPVKYYSGPFCDGCEPARLISTFRPSIVLASGHRERTFGQTRTLQRNLRSGCVDLAQIVGRKLDLHRPEIFIEPIELRGAGDRYDPRFLSEQPCERDLRRSCIFALSDLRAANPPKPDWLSTLRAQSEERLRGSRSRRTACSRPFFRSEILCPAD